MIQTKNPRSFWFDLGFFVLLLMHDLYENTAIAFERAADILTADGYELVTVSELLGEELEAGKVFSKGKPIEATAGAQK